MLPSHVRRAGLLVLVAAMAASPAGSRPAQIPSGAQHDFDWEIGSWKSDLRRLKKPLSGSSEWVHYTGTTEVRKVWGGKANLVELEVDGPTGHFEALSLRLYDPQSHQWSLNYANAASGQMSVTPAIGGFHNGRGEFYDQERYGDRTVLVRFVISNITRNSAHFEQAFSADGGRTWETNWIVTDTRIGARRRP